MHAFEMAMKQGYSHIETDPCLTKDGVVVLFHDKTINRTCRNPDGSVIESPLKLEDLTYEELMRYDAGIAWGEQFKGTKVPKLSELLELAQGTDVIIALDKKISAADIDKLIDVVAQYDTKVSFSCADEERIKAVQKRLPDAMIDYDGNTLDEDLEKITKLVKYDNLLVWLYLDKPNFSWLIDRVKTSPENCERVKRYARLGIANVNNPCDVMEAFAYLPDIIEV